MARSLKDLSSRLRDILFQGGENLQAWGTVAKSPSLRQEYKSRVVQPGVKRVQRAITPPGGFGAASQRVRQTIPQIPSSFYRQVAKPAAKTVGQYYVDTAKSVPPAIGAAFRFTPPYQIFRGLQGKPVTPTETLTDIGKILTPIYRAHPATPFRSMALGAIKEARLGKPPVEVIKGAEKGLKELPGVGEALYPNNPTMARVADVVFMGAMVAKPYATKKLNQINLRTDEINKVSKTLGVSSNAPLAEVTKAWKDKVRRYSEVFAGRGTPEQLATVKELNSAKDILYRAGVVEKTWARAYGALTDESGFARFGLLYPEKIPEEIGGLLKAKDPNWWGDVGRRIESGKLTKGDLSRLQLPQFITRTDIKALLKYSPEFASKPNLTVIDKAGEKVLVFNGLRDKFIIIPKALGLLPKDLARLHKGDVINVAQVIKEKGVLPSLSELPKQEGVGKVKIKAQEAKPVLRTAPAQPLTTQKLPVSPEPAPQVVPGIPPTGEPSKAIIPDTEKYAFNVNLNRLGLTPEEKQVVRTTVDSIKPELKKAKGKTLSNNEVVEAAKKSEILTKVTTRDETLAANATLLKARQRLVGLDKDITRLAKEGNEKQLKKQMTDLVESLRVVSSTAADTGRKLQSFAIGAEDQSIRQRVLEDIGKIETDTAKIVSEAAKVNWEDTKSITTFYRKFVKPSTSDILDEYRYNNMLSNPKTHLRNAFSNVIQTFVTRPATLVAMGKPKEAAKYYKGALSSFPEAVEAFKKSFTGAKPIGKPDLPRIATKKLPGFMTAPTRAMEAADKFFSALIRGGELARGATPEAAGKTAEYSLLRQELYPEGQGKVLNAIDSFTAWTYKAPKAVRWFVPFVRTPMNFAKQWIEYSPAGLATLPGATAKKEQLAKALVGSVIAAIGAKFALEEDTTWDAPTDPTQKKLFYASGRKPFSVKIKGKWVPMMYAGPFAVAFALPAAAKYYQDESRTALTDSQEEKLTKSVASMARFLSGQTFLSGINNFVKFFSGDVDYSLPGNLAFTAGQMIPLQGLVRYISTIVDPIYRKGRGFEEGLKKSLPFLSQELEPHTTPFGEPSRRDPINYALPYDIGVPKPEYEPMLQRRTEKLQENALVNKLKKEYEAESPVITKDGTIEFGLPTDDAASQELYKDAMAKVKNLESKLLTLPYEPRLPYEEVTRESDIQETQAELGRWQSVIDKFETERPEVVFDLNVSIHVSGGGKTTAERAKWVSSVLEETQGELEKNSKLEKMYQEKVMTDSVVDELNDKYGISLPYAKDLGMEYGTKTAGTKAGKKAAKVTIKKVSAPKITFKALGRGKVPTLKLKKPPTIKVGATKRAKLALPSKELPKIKAKPVSYALTLSK